MLARTARTHARRSSAGYEAFEFHRVYHAVNEFAIVDLSSFYLDVLKDRMYTFAPTITARRSAQTVLWQITEALVRLVAPILSFTADEVWEYLPKIAGREESVHLALFPKPEEIFSADPAYLINEWKQFSSIYGESVFVHSKKLRQSKVIGKALEADVEIYAAGDIFDLLRKHEESLKKSFSTFLAFDCTRSINRIQTELPNHSVEVV